jgi:hypothetical protein
MRGGSGMRSVVTGNDESRCANANNLLGCRAGGSVAIEQASAADSNESEIPMQILTDKVFSE